jgi:hypothetical protein
MLKGANTLIHSYLHRSSTDGYTGAAGSPLSAVFRDFGDIYDGEPSFGIEDALEDLRVACRTGELPELDVDALDLAVACFSGFSLDDGPGGKHEGFTIRDLMCLNLYTTEFSGGNSLYKIMNANLCHSDRRKVRPFVKYIWLLLKAMTKCEPSPARTVFRGLKEVDLTGAYSKNQIIQWSAFSSATSDLEVQKQFCGKEGCRTLLSIELTTKSGRDISKYSFTPDEREVLLPPNTRFKVTGLLDLGNSLTMIHLRELVPADPIVRFRGLNVPAVDMGSPSVYNSSFSAAAAREDVDTSIQRKTTPASVVGLGSAEIVDGPAAYNPGERDTARRKSRVSIVGLSSVDASKGSADSPLGQILNSFFGAAGTQQEPSPQPSQLGIKKSKSKSKGSFTEFMTQFRNMVFVDTNEESANGANDPYCQVVF